MTEIDKIFKFLPKSVSVEIKKICESRQGASERISEIHLRAIGKSTVDIGNERVFLFSSVNRDDMWHSLSLLTEGAFYSAGDSIRRGYLTLPCGVRVGISGRARYDKGIFVGVESVSALVFRIPTARFDAAEALFSAWRETERGILIFSPPAVGKTTALRELVYLVGGGIERLKVAVIDERCEFYTENLNYSTVDVLSGYPRAEGIEIALRSLSPEVIAIDEIGREEESLGLLDSMNSGVRIIATAHGGSFREVLKRKNLLPFFKKGIFDTLVMIEKRQNERFVEKRRIE